MRALESDEAGSWPVTILPSRTEKSARIVRLRIDFLVKELLQQNEAPPDHLARP